MHGGRSTASGRSRCSTTPTLCPPGRSVVRHHGPTARSPCPGTGPSRTSATCRTTPTCRCRSPGRRLRCPSAIPPVCTGGRSPSARAGAANAWCCTWAVPRACTRCTSTTPSSATAPTVACPASTTSRRICRPEPTTWLSWWCATARRATSKTKISGGWRACTAACGSRRAARCTWPMWPAPPTCAWPTAWACCRCVPPWGSRRNRPRASSCVPGWKPWLVAGWVPCTTPPCRTGSSSRTCSRATPSMPGGRCRRWQPGAPSHPAATGFVSSCCGPTAQSPRPPSSWSASGTSRCATANCW